MELKQITCDSVPFFWIEAPPPYRVGLLFRVGRGDETLAASGVTHLCEHLALSSLHGAPYPYNGAVDVNRSVFFCHGTAEESRAFLEEVCRRLAALPVNQLDREKRILRAEAAARGASIVNEMMVDRFGAQGYGLIGYPELGLWSLDAEAVRAWAARWFTRGNAVGYIVGPAPLEATLPLPPGERIGLPTIHPRPQSYPAVVRHPGRVVGMTSLIQRSPKAFFAMGVILAHLQRVLRYEMGSTYQVLPAYLRLTTEMAYISMTSDVAATQPADPVLAFLKTLEDIAVHGPKDEDVEQQRAAAVAALSAHGSEMVQADSAAFGTLVGSAYTSRKELEAAYSEVTSEEIRAISAAMRDSALYQVPAGLEVKLDGLAPLPAWSSWSADGITFQPEPFLSGLPERFVVGDRGLTVWVGKHPVSVAWNQVAAVQAWGDGSRRVIGTDSFQVNMLPSRVRKGSELTLMIDVHTVKGLRVESGKRLMPPVAPFNRRDPRARKRWATHQLTYAIIGLLLIALIAGLVSYGREWGFSRATTFAFIDILFIRYLAQWLYLQRRAVASVGGDVEGIEVYDLADVHAKRLPQGVPAGRALVRGGHLLAFVVLRDLTSKWFAKESREAMARLSKREITGADLYNEWGGVLASDMVSPEGNGFLFDFLAVRSGHGSRYKHILEPETAKHGGFYNIPPDWEVYDRLVPSLERELVRWKRLRRVYKLLRYFRAPPSF